MEKTKHYIIPFRTYFLILLGLITFTFMSIGITKINLGGYSVLGALIFSSCKSALVLIFFMHLKFDKLYLRFLILFVILVFLTLILITFLDYYFR